MFRRAQRPPHRPPLRAATIVRAGLGALLVALGLAVVPLPAAVFVADYRSTAEPLRFEAVSAASPRSAEPVTSEIAEVEPFVTIGVKLEHAPQEPVSVRWREGGSWSDWTVLDVEPDKGPDRASAEAAAVPDGEGVLTQPLWVGRADAYQVRLPGDQAAPEAIVVRPDGGRLSVSTDSVDAGAQSVGSPSIHPRSDWGARGPSNSVGSASELKLAVVHHSATGNDYSPGEVPGIIRSIQAYHMDGNGWSDIGYNFIVDKYGGMWEGRDGSLLRNSVGAHAEGFNTGSVGVMALGNFSSGAPSSGQVSNIADVIAWRFAVNGVDPSSRVDVTSGGSSTVPAGTVVNLPRVIGHRDVGSTDCPGSNLYSQIASRIRPILPALVSAKASPIGVIDGVVAGPGQVLVAGWAFDPLVTAPIEVHAYVDNVGYNLGPTPVDRFELATAYPGAGVRHGYYAGIGGLSPGPHQVCIFAINTGAGSNTLLGCRSVVVPSGDPIGVLDLAVGAPDGVIGVSGWMLDPDTTASIDTHLYVDGVGYNLGAAAQPRPDLGVVFPLYGPAHGYGWSRGGFAPGPHSVCVFAINSGAGANRLLECRTVVVPGGAPLGVVDHAVGLPDGRIAMSGWTIDRDTAGATEVHVYVDGRGTNIGRASGDRPDIARAFPGYGPAHGYSWTGAGFAPGLHNACAFAIDTTGGPATLLRCQGLAVPGGSPFGSIDAVTAGGSRLGITGWVIDPDTASPVNAHVYIDGVGYDAGPSAASRPDVAAAVPGYGAAHGISWLSPPLAAGPHRVCVFGINTGLGGNSLLDCRTVTV